MAAISSGETNGVRRLSHKNGVKKMGANKVEVLKSIWHVMEGRVEREVVVRLQSGEVEVFQDPMAYTGKEALEAFIGEAY